ncbi:MAG: hypothetical protein Q9227_006694 [Pyrenula ochraceoflavens]
MADWLSNLSEDTKHLERNHLLQAILDHIESFADKFNLIDYDSLRQDVLKPVLADAFDPEIQIRGFLKAIRHTDGFKKAFEEVESSQLRDQIESFVDGQSSEEVVAGRGFEVKSHPSPGAKHHFSLLDALKKLTVSGLGLKERVQRLFKEDDIEKHRKHVPIIFEDAAEKKIMEAYSDVPFENWGQSVQNKPKFTMVPSTVLGIQNLVKYAAEQDLRVRCAGFRHSWSSIFSQDNHIFVSFVNLEEVTTLPDPMSLIPGEYTTEHVPELKTIELKGEVSEGKRLCRIGSAVTNEDFRRWSVANKAWAIPVDVILVEVTIGGVNGPICHGAGWRHKTISDYVRSIEYVDCNGKLQEVNDPEHLKTAAGCFGLLGVVTHITFELDAMTYAVMEPRKVDVCLAIPPLDKEEIPPALRSSWHDSQEAPKLLADAKTDFFRRAKDDYYSEWFWFTYQQRAWVNTWKNDPSADNLNVYPSPAQVFLAWLEGWLGNVLISLSFFQALPGPWQAQLLATAGMAALPPTLGEDKTPTFKSALPDALHFRRGVQNMRVRDMELQVPIPATTTGEPDFSIVQRAWWDVIKLVYADVNCPMRLTLELRIMGDSKILMAPQRGNRFGTASIEILTIPDAVADNEWYGFCNKVADKWTSYAQYYPGQEELLKVRTHWAKEWEAIEFGGVKGRQYVKTVCRDQIDAFKEGLEGIANAQGWDLVTGRKRFSNELLDDIVFGV